MDEFDVIIAGVYDCAVNPELWPQTLELIRSAFGCAYVMFGFADFSTLSGNGIAMQKLRYTSWDTTWFEKLERYLPNLPGIDALWREGVDVPWIQMEHLVEAEFHKTDFYREWVRPQALRDCLNVLYHDRKLMRGVITFATSAGAPLLGKREKHFAARLSPHVRRAVSINSMVDRCNLALALYREVLDCLSVAVLIVTGSGRLVYSNARADMLLSRGEYLVASNGLVRARQASAASGHLESAIAKAASGARDLGIAGIGVPLVGTHGEIASAYVLPLDGDDLRGQIAPRHAAIFVAQRSEQQPMAIEILRTIFRLTPTEAKVAYATSLGETPNALATAHGTTVNAIRYHLKNVYLKAGVNDKTALAAAIAALLPPTGR